MRLVGSVYKRRNRIVAETILNQRPGEPWRDIGPLQFPGTRLWWRRKNVPRYQPCARNLQWPR